MTSSSKHQKENGYHYIHIPAYLSASLHNYSYTTYALFFKAALLDLGIPMPLKRTNSGKKRLGEAGVSVARAGMASVFVSRADTGFRFTLEGSGCHCT